MKRENPASINETMKQAPYVRMVIGETAADEAVAEFLKIWTEQVEPLLPSERGFIDSRVLTEEGGRLILMQTVWATRDDCIRYHCSRAYRRLVAKTQHLLIGDFVVKLFHQHVPVHATDSTEEGRS